MSPVLDRDALEASPLADLHVIATELGLDGFRRLRKADLIDAIVARQSGDATPAPEPDEEPAAEAEAEAEVEVAADADDDEESRPRRNRRGGRGRSRARDTDPGDEAPADEPRARRARDEDDDEDRPRGRNRGRGRDRDRDRDEAPVGEDRTVEGIVDLLPNGSGFLRVTEGETSDDDVYVSAAQVKRCELVAGDKVAGPVRPPRRSERYPSLVRVETINGKSADASPEGVTRFDDLPAAFPQERLALGGDDPTVKAIEWLTPFGKGSRVVITGPARSGKTEALRRIAGALQGQDGLEVSVVLAGVRPEEMGEWEPKPAAAASFAASPDAQAQAVEAAIEQARRVAARGGDAVVLVDSLDLLSPQAARRATAAARNLTESGSLTVIATATAPLGGETTVIALNQTLVSLGRFPALDLEASGTLRPELLVGDAGAEAIAKARADALA
jgi:transcription termination factor Rho